MINIMPSKPLKPKNKINTLDEFAAAIHRDYVAISEKMATKDDIQSIRGEMATKLELGEVKMTLKHIQEDVKQITDNMVSKAGLENTIRDEFGKSDHAKKIEKLHERVSRIEEKLGIRETRHAT